MDHKHKAATTKFYEAVNKIESLSADPADAWKVGAVREEAYDVLREMAKSTKDDDWAMVVAFSINELKHIEPALIAELINLLLDHNGDRADVVFGLAASLLPERGCLSEGRTLTNVLRVDAASARRAIDRIGNYHGDAGIQFRLARTLSVLVPVMPTQVIQIARNFADQSDDEDILRELAVQMSGLARWVTDNDVGFIAVALAERANLKTIELMVDQLGETLDDQSSSILAGYMDIEPVFEALAERAQEFVEEDDYGEIMDRLRYYKDGGLPSDDLSAGPAW